jgi:hypothetical protein
MPRRNDWNNTVMDARVQAMQASLTRADQQADASHPSKAMRPVVDAASGPAESSAAPLVSTTDRLKVQP